MRHKSGIRERVRVVGMGGPSGAIGQRLRRLAEWAVAGCVTAAVGCGQDAPNSLHQGLVSGADGPWQSMVCADLLLAADPLQPAHAFDYFALFTRGASDGRPASLVGDYGNPCQTARDRAACVSALGERVKQAPLADPSLLVVPVFAVTTTGDAVERLDDGAALARVLAPIDTSSEALLAAQFGGLRHACANRSVSGAFGAHVQATATGYRVKSAWQECGVSNGVQQLEVSTEGVATALLENNVMRSNCAVGRRPEGLKLSAGNPGCEPLARLLSQTAQLEAASVPAFLRLARELRQLGAPALARRAQQSAQDEVRHTRQMQLLAARYQAAPARYELQRPARSRGAAEVARDNAVEGCVRETFGALIAWHQAATARDPIMAQVMREIAADETRHAELSWEIAAWLEPQLPARERAQVDRARSRAIAQLSAEIAADPLPPAARAQIGWPSIQQQQGLLQHMAAELALS